MADPPRTVIATVDLPETGPAALVDEPPTDAGADPAPEEPSGEDQNDRVGLAPGNVLAVLRADDELEASCHRVARHCAGSDPFLEDVPHSAYLIFEEMAPGRFRSSQAHLRGATSEALEQCFNASIRVESLSGKTTGCGLGLKRVINDDEEVAGRVGACLGPMSGVDSVTVHWVLYVNGSLLEVHAEANRPLDEYAQRCIEQAAAPAPVRVPGLSPGFTRRRYTLTVATHDLERRGPVVRPELPPLPTTDAGDPGQIELAQGHKESAYALLSAKDLEGAISHAQACILAAPRLGKVAQKLSHRDSSREWAAVALKAFRRQLELDPVDSPTARQFEEMLTFAEGVLADGGIP